MHRNSWYTLLKAEEGHWGGGFMGSMGYSHSTLADKIRVGLSFLDANLMFATNL